MSQDTTLEISQDAYVLSNARIATMQPQKEAYGLIEEGAIAVENGRIAWVGAMADLPQQYDPYDRFDVRGALITPGLIDCHSHVVFGGNRAREFEMRLQGASYQEVAAAGGGIVSTVSATRAATEEELLSDALTRVDTMIAEGVTTLEIKSGYGLDRDTELRMLRVARAIAANRALTVSTSFLGAHAIPKEFEGDGDRYLAEVCLPTLRAAETEKLVDMVDGFCETVAFSKDQIAKVFECAQELGLPVKLHAEQLSNLGGARLAAQYGARSVDHVEYLDADGVRALAASGTVAVLLPGAFYTLRETQLPPVELLRAEGVPIALATDCNPGTSPLTSPLLTLNMGCTLFRMTPEEALAGMTRVAAQALGLTDRGMLAEGMRADLAIWDVEHPAELSYRIGFNPLRQRIFGA